MSRQERPQTTLPAQQHPKPYLIQWERTLRWRERAVASIARSGGIETFDFLFALLTSIFQTRDWISASRRDLEKDVAALFSGSANLTLVRDLANAVKHMETTRYRSDGAATIAREYAGSGEHRYVVPRPAGGNIEVIHLADACIVEVRAFMELHDLI